MNSSSPLQSNWFFALLFVFTFPLAGVEPLPLPEERLPDAPPFPASMVTPRGRRRLMEGTGVTLHFDAEQRRLRSNYPGCWLINFPLREIEGLEHLNEDQISRKLFNQPRAELKNWYIRCPGPPPDEPPEAEGPAPIRPHAATRVVDASHGAADDGNPGTSELPLKSIGAALARAEPGDVIHVHPGIYRESLVFPKAGTASEPIRVEGIRDEHGRMPVVSGNDVFPDGSWEQVDGLPDVYRAPIFTDREGPVSRDGRLLRERTLPEELEAGEFCFNRGALEMVNPRVNPDTLHASGIIWTPSVADEAGTLSVSDRTPDKVYYASTWVWASEEAWSGTVHCEGPFRSFRMTGTDLNAQANLLRLWVNGELLPAPAVSGKPRAYSDYGWTERWESFSLLPGWNHLFFQFNSSHREKDGELRFGFRMPELAGGIISVSEKPDDLTRPPEGGEAFAYVSEWKIAGPFDSPADRSVYVRMPPGRHPSEFVLDLPARNTLAHLDKPFTQVRGLEFRHGAQFQQRAQALLEAEGTVLEGCLLREAEVRGITVVTAGMDQTQAPILLRNNWIVSPGHVGVGITPSGESRKHLTAENQNLDVPGRGRMIAEYNRVIDNNRSLYPRWWESGAFKVFQMSGSIIRNNTIIGGDGPGIWLDWEHFNNRIEGNLSIDGTAFAVAVEASPGPNLVANTIAVNLKPGGVWFRAGVLSWSSHRTWAVHNTLDGRWNREGGTWKGRTGTDGIYLHEGAADRGTLWGALPKEQAAFNNLIVGSPVAVDTLFRTEGSVMAGNLTDPSSRDPEVPRVHPAFLDRAGMDYRPAPGQPVLREAAVTTPVTEQVRYDFYGLLRFSGEACVGAVREEPLPADPESVLIELERTDGEMMRLYEVLPRP